MPVDIWQIGGGNALISEQAGRTVAYEATGGKQGVAAPTHLAVAENTPNDGFVTVAPGVVKILNTFGDTFFEMYVGRINAETLVPIPPTGAGAPKSYLIVYEITDPYAEGSIWQEADIDDLQDGPYYLLHAVECTSTTRTFDQLDLDGRCGYALARVDMPASTATVIDDYITELRNLSAPKDGQEGHEEQKPVSAEATLDNTETTFTQWPPEAEWVVNIPSWATHVLMTLSGTAVYSATARFKGEIRGTVVGVGSTDPYKFYVDRPGSNLKTNIGPFVFTYAIPKSIRGTTKTVQLEARSTDSAGNGDLVADADSTFRFKANFYQLPER